MLSPEFIYSMQFFSCFPAALTDQKEKVARQNQLCAPAKFMYVVVSRWVPHPVRLVSHRASGH
jgi:hypothetical protein